MQDVQAILSVGTSLRERYLVTSLIGKGDSGAVYLVKDQRVKRARQNLFALKEVIGLNKQERYQFTLDSVSLRQLSHRALPRIHHVINDDKRDQVYIVMDYVEGPDLETLWQQQPEQRFSWPEVADIMAPIVDAVSYLHRQESPIVHGDIKPVNIILAQPEERYMLVDVGVAREHQPDASALQDMPGYRAPEQYGKSVDVRADLYGLGATCYTLLTGVVPSHALVRLAQLEREQTDPLQPASTIVSTIPSHVSQAVQRAMALRADERFSSIEEVWQALQTPPKEHKPIVDKVVSSAKTPTLDVTEQRRALMAVETPLLSRQPRRNTSPFESPASVQRFEQAQKDSQISLLKRYAVPLLLLTLLLLVGAGVGIWSFAHSSHPISTAANHTASPPTLPTPVLKSTVPILTPTSLPGNYPVWLAPILVL